MNGIESLFLTQERRVVMVVSIAKRLHKRLLALGCDVGVPKRIWLGGAHDSSDLWRWEAPETRGGGSIGCEHSMAECLKMSDERLKVFLDHSSGRGFFYPDYDSRAAAIKRLKAHEIDQSTPSPTARLGTSK